MLSFRSSQFNAYQILYASEFGKETSMFLDIVGINNAQSMAKQTKDIVERFLPENKTYVNELTGVLIDEIILAKNESDMKHEKVHQSLKDIKGLNMFSLEESLVLAIEKDEPINYLNEIAQKYHNTNDEPEFIKNTSFSKWAEFIYQYEKHLYAFCTHLIDKKGTAEAIKTAEKIVSGLDSLSREEAFEKYKHRIQTISKEINFSKPLYFIDTLPKQQAFSSSDNDLTIIQNGFFRENEDTYLFFKLPDQIFKTTVPEKVKNIKEYITTKYMAP